MGSSSDSIGPVVRSSEAFNVAPRRRGRRAPVRTAGNSASAAPRFRWARRTLTDVVDDTDDLAARRAADGTGGPVAVAGSNEGSNPTRKHRPMALLPGQIVRAMVSLTSATGGPASSRCVKRRPWTISSCRTSNSSGVVAMRKGSCPLIVGGCARPGTPNGGTLNPVNGSVPAGAAAATPGSARTRSIAAPNS